MVVGRSLFVRDNVRFEIIKYKLDKFKNKKERLLNIMGRIQLHGHLLILLSSSLSYSYLDYAGSINITPQCSIILTIPMRY